MINSLPETSRRCSETTILTVSRNDQLIDFTNDLQVSFQQQNSSIGRMTKGLCNIDNNVAQIQQRMQTIEEINNAGQNELALQRQNMQAMAQQLVDI